MSERRKDGIKRVREPVQVYLAGDDLRLLGDMSASLGISKAEILRRGIRSYAAQSGADTPMMQFLSEDVRGWPKAGTAQDHDAVIAASHKPMKKKRA